MDMIRISLASSARQASTVVAVGAVASSALPVATALSLPKMLSAGTWSAGQEARRFEADVDHAVQGPEGEQVLRGDAPFEQPGSQVAQATHVPGVDEADVQRHRPVQDGERAEGVDLLEVHQPEHVDDRLHH